MSNSIEIFKRGKIISSLPGETLPSLSPTFKMTFLNFILDKFSAVSPTEWEAYSENNIAKARNTRSMSENLRRKIQELLGSAFQQLNNQNAKVQLAFGKRITETTNAKRQLESQHRRVSRYLHYMPM